MSVRIVLGLAVLSLGALGFSAPHKAPEACNVTLTYLGPKNITVGTYTSGNTASWQIANNGAAFTISSQTPTSSGAITGTTSNLWFSIPGTFPASFGTDADISFDVGAAGTGSVGLTLDASCGTITFPNHPVTIQ
jgi:hypothetical protein